jgi:hypothetical protein
MVFAAATPPRNDLQPERGRQSPARRDKDSRLTGGSRSHLIFDRIGGLEYLGGMEMDGVYRDVELL